MKSRLIFSISISMVSFIALGSKQNRRPSNDFPRLTSTMNAIKNAEIHNASYKREWQRYPSPIIFVNFLRNTYPVVSEKVDPSLNYPISGVSAIGKCLFLVDKNSGGTGYNNPISGEPNTQFPDISFVTWYLNCVKTLTSETWNQVTFPNRSTGEPSLVNLEVAKKDPSLMKWISHFNSTKIVWEQLNPELRLNMISELFHSKFGPHEIFEELIEGFNFNDYVKQTDSEILLATKSASQKLSYLGYWPTNSQVDAYFFALGLFAIEDFLQY